MPSVSLMNTFIEIESSTDAESEMVRKTLVVIESSMDTASNVSNTNTEVTVSVVVTDSPLAPSVNLMNTFIEIESSTDTESEARGKVSIGEIKLSIDTASNISNDNNEVTVSAVVTD